MQRKLPTQRSLTGPSQLEVVPRRKHWLRSQRRVLPKCWDSGCYCSSQQRCVVLCFLLVDGPTSYVEEWRLLCWSMDRRMKNDPPYHILIVFRTQMLRYIQYGTMCKVPYRDTCTTDDMILVFIGCFDTTQLSRGIENFVDSQQWTFFSLWSLGPFRRKRHLQHIQ